MKCLFVYNPNSGKGKIKKYLNKIKNIFNEKCEEYFIMSTSCKEDIKKFIQEKGETVDLLVISGGDGTISEAVNAIARLNKKPNLAILPTGTVNDIAHSLNIPRLLPKAIDNIFKGEASACDCIKVNDRYGVYVFGGGLFTETSYATTQSSKKFWGKIAYAFHAISRAFKNKNLNLRFAIEKENFEVLAPLFLIINSRYVAGLKVNKNAILNDGKSTLIIFKSKKENSNIFDMIKVANMFVNGVEKAKQKYIIKKEISSIKITSPKILNYNLDGELYQAQNLNVSIVPNVVNIVLPKQKGSSKK